MSIILKSIALLTIISIVSNGVGAQNNGPDVFALADKLSELFSAISGTKLTVEEQLKLKQFQESLMNTWYTISNTIKNIDSSKLLDAYIALINNQKQLLGQILNVFNLDQLNKWSQMIADTLQSVSNIPGMNCTNSTTGCQLPWNNNNNTSGSNSSISFTTIEYPWFTNSSNSNNTTWYPTGSYYTSNFTTGNPFVTEYPFSNFTGTYFPSNFTTGSWNFNTTGSVFNFTTGSWNFNTTDSPFNFTTGSWNFNTTGSWSGNSTDSWVTTNSPSNFTSWSWSNTTGFPSYNTTGSFNTNVTISSPVSNNNSTSTNSTLNSVFIDSEFCKFYSLADCANRIEISLLCPAMCRCSAFQCKNNGTMAIQDGTGQCKCLCKSGFNGELCENSLCSEKEYCSYFNDSYCSVTMIDENCPKLCGRC